MKRKIEIIAFEHERIIRRTGDAGCPICGSAGRLLTTAQAGQIAGVNIISIRRWLGAGRAHGVKTAGGQHRVCRISLFQIGSRNKQKEYENGTTKIYANDLW